MSVRVRVFNQNNIKKKNIFQNTVVLFLFMDIVDLDHVSKYMLERSWGGLEMKTRIALVNMKSWIQPVILA